MSHYVVVVVTDKPDDVESALAPYDENLDVDTYPNSAGTVADHARNARDWYGEHPQYAPEDLLRHRIPADPQDGHPGDIVLFGSPDGDDTQVFIEYDLTFTTHTTTSDFGMEETHGTWNNPDDARAFLKALPEEVLALTYSRDDYTNVRVEGDQVMYDSTSNPDGLWDWWTIGGRWRGYFHLKPTDPDSPEPGELGEPGVPEIMRLRDGQAGEDYTGRADQVQWKNVDRDARREAARAKANQEYDEFEAVTAGIDPPEQSFSELVDSVLTASGVPTDWFEYLAATAERREAGDKSWREPWDNAIQQARERWHAHPWVMAFRAARIWADDPIKDYCVHAGGRDEYVRRAVNAAGVPYALIVDGQWIAKGHMGWFGMSDDTVTQDDWNAKVQELFDSLDGEKWVTAVDCHI